MPGGFTVSKTSSREEHLESRLLSLTELVYDFFRALLIQESGNLITAHHIGRTLTNSLPRITHTYVCDASTL